MLLLLDLAVVAAPLWFLLPPEPRVVIDGKHNPYWLSPEGGRLYMDGKLWDTHSGEAVSAFMEHAGWPTIAPDGRHIAAVNGSFIFIGDCQTGREWSAELPPDSNASELKFSPDGDLLAVRANDETIVILETASGRILERLDAEAGSPSFFGFTSRGDYFVYTASVNKTPQAGLWNTRTRGLEAVLKIDGPVALSPDCRTILATHGPSDENGVALYDLDPTAKHPRAHLRVKGFDPFGGFAFSADSRTIATWASGWTETSVAEFWNVETGQLIAALPEVAVYGGAFSPDGSHFALSSVFMTGQNRNRSEWVKLTLHEVANGREVWARTWGRDSYDCRPQFSVSGKILQVYVEGRVEILDAATGQTLGAARFRKRPRSGSCWTTDSYFTTPDRRLHLIREEMKNAWFDPTWTDRARAFLRLPEAPDGTTNWDMVSILEMETGREVFHLESEGTTGPALLAGNGRTLVTQHADFIAIWDVPTWPPLRWAVGAPLGVWAVLCLAAWLRGRKRNLIPVTGPTDNKPSVP